MDSGDLRAAVYAFDPEAPTESAWMPPSSWYTEPAFHALERRAVFACSWWPAARLEQLASPRSWVAGRAAGEPYVVVRDGDGVLRAFHNVCSHKAREVVTGCGTGAEALVCGYHAWRYDLDGALRSAPRMAGVRDFDRDHHGLRPLRVEAWGHWAFVNADPYARPLAASVGELHLRLEASSWRDLRYVGAQTWDIACNWKVYVDNYLDGGYHIPHMHPSLDAQIDMASYRTEVFSGYSIQTTAPHGDHDRTALSVDLGRRIGQGAIYGWLYPAFMINRYGECLDTNLVVPLGPDRCRVRYEFYFADPDAEGAAAFIEESRAQSDVTQREDIEICESVQVGLASLAYDRGRYAPRVEHGEHAFHKHLAADLRRAIEP